MTPDEFRKVALSFPETEERSHMNHPDFRVGGKIFASLGYPDDAWGMVKLTPAQQRSLVEQAPNVFHPCAGAWGRNGSTSIRLALVKSRTLRAALDAAYRNVRAQGKAKKS